MFTLSSTHLPFLLPIFRELFPETIFLDPADSVAKQISKLLEHKVPVKRKLKIYTSGDVVKFQKQLSKIGIKNIVNSL